MRIVVIAVHLGSGRAYVEHEGARYLHAPGHNPAIVSHEVAHHVSGLWPTSG